MLDLTISIVNHRNCNLLEPMLDSILAHTRDITFEVFVVDNVPGEGSAARIAHKYPDVHFIYNQHPQGFAQNNNQVLSQVRSRYVVLLNDDMLLQNDALGHMVAFMDGHPQTGAVGCKLLNPDGTVQRSCWIGFPSARTLLADLFYLSILWPNAKWINNIEVSLRDSQTPVAVDHLLGACMMVRASTLDQIGLLDETFVMFLEETDWCYRIRQQGCLIYWVPDGRIVHFGQTSVSKDPQSYKPMLYQNYYRFCKKHGASKIDLLMLKIIIMAGVLFRAGLWGFRSLAGHPNGSNMVKGYVRTFAKAVGF